MSKIKNNYLLKLNNIVVLNEFNFQIYINNYQQKLFILILLLMIGYLSTGCAKKVVEEIEVKPNVDSTLIKWKGDNMTDFQAEGLSVSSIGSERLPRVPYEERKVGIAYTTWFQSGIWNQSVWTFPTLGKYLSDDRTIIRKHAEWLADAGVDFIWIDWSNDLDYNVSIDKVLTDLGRTDFAMIERSTLFIFEEYSKMRVEGKKTPNISIFIGNPAAGQASAVSDGRLTRKADQIDQWFLNNSAHPEFRTLMQEHNGKPLLVCYTGTPTPWAGETPPWNDNRFTVRFMTGFVTEQHTLFHTYTKESKYKYWSWEERGAQTYTVDKGFPEAMTVVPSWRSQGKQGETGYIPAGPRNDGKTFMEQWARARLLGVRFAMVGTWNEYVTGEQRSAEVSKDIEPNETWGDKYLVLLKNEIKKFKGVE